MCQILLSTGTAAWCGLNQKYKLSYHPRFPFGIDLAEYPPSSRDPLRLRLSFNIRVSAIISICLRGSAMVICSGTYNIRTLWEAWSRLYMHACRASPCFESGIVGQLEEWIFPERTSCLYAINYPHCRNFVQTSGRVRYFMPPKFASGLSEIGASLGLNLPDLERTYISAG